MELLIGLGLAILSTVVLDVGYLLQQRSVSGLPEMRLTHPIAALRGFLVQRRWVLGVGLSGLGFGFYFVALGFADLSLVQAASAGGIALLAVIAVRFFGETLGRAEIVGAVLATLGLLAIGLSLVGHDDSGREEASDTVLFIWLGVSVGVALCLMMPRGRAAGALGGLAAGVLFAAGDVASKGLLVDLPDDVTVGSVLRAPYLYAAVVIYTIGFLSQQRAFQRGTAVTAIGIMVAATNVLPIVAGLAVFRDPLPDTPLGITARLGGFVLVVIGSVLLARVSEGGGEAKAGPVTATA
jgi:drug/metabolite transporter (DMT)-like permease